MEINWERLLESLEIFERGFLVLSIGTILILEILK